MCKKAGFLQKYISVKKLFFCNFIFVKSSFLLQKYVFVKKQYFYNRSICKKTAILHENDAFLEGPFFCAT